MCFAAGLLLCAHVAALHVLSLASAVQRVQIYPCYINSKRTVAAGRKIAKAKGRYCYACHHVGCWPCQAREDLCVQRVRTQRPWRLSTAATKA